MKVENHNGHLTSITHPWLTTTCVFLGLGCLVLALLWLRKCRASAQQKHEYSAVNTDSGSEKFFEKHYSGAFKAYRQRLTNSGRYELKTQLGDIGSRAEKQWFIVQDVAIGAERLLTIVPLPPSSPLTPSEENKNVLLELFRGLQHPYIHPVLDIEFWNEEAAIITPLNPSGSLKDLIYGAAWHDSHDRKYSSKAEGLPIRTIQCLGRQILEALLFLRNKHFPPLQHLHSGNVIIQNGVARIAGLENTLFGLNSKLPPVQETSSFGYLLFEMSSGYELRSPPTAAHLEIELERAPKVSDCLSLIFHSGKGPVLEEVLCSDLFRGVELRELRGAAIAQLNQPQEVLELLELVKNPPPVRVRRLHCSKEFEPWFA